MAAAFIDKFIAFIDVLGFKQLIERAESGGRPDLEEIHELLASLGSTAQRAQFRQYGPMACPHAPFHEKSLDYRYSQVSDCAVLSTELSPAGVINLIAQCNSAAIRLLQQGRMCRGYITRGKIHHTEDRFDGSGYQRAYEGEQSVSVFKRDADERGTPFIEVDQKVADFIRDCSDECVKDVFSRMTRHDGERFAIFPFQLLAHSFVIGDYLGHKFSISEERESNDAMRGMLLEFRNGIRKNTDVSNESAVRKSEHYIEALDRQLGVCDQNEQTFCSLERSGF